MSTRKFQQENVFKKISKTIEVSFINFHISWLYGNSLCVFYLLFLESFLINIILNHLFLFISSYFNNSIIFYFISDYGGTCILSQLIICIKYCITELLKEQYF